MPLPECVGQPEIRPQQHEHRFAIAVGAQHRCAVRLDRRTELARAVDELRIGREPAEGLEPRRPAVAVQNMALRAAASRRTRAPRRAGTETRSASARSPAAAEVGLAVARAASTQQSGERDRRARAAARPARASASPPQPRQRQRREDGQRTGEAEGAPIEAVLDGQQRAERQDRRAQPAATPPPGRASGAGPSPNPIGAPRRGERIEQRMSAFAPSPSPSSGRSARQQPLRPLRRRAPPAACARAPNRRRATAAGEQRDAAVVPEVFVVRARVARPSAAPPRRRRAGERRVAPRPAPPAARRRCPRRSHRRTVYHERRNAQRIARCTCRRRVRRWRQASAHGPNRRGGRGRGTAPTESPSRGTARR